MQDAVAPESARRRRSTPRRRVSVFGVLGEVLITAGVVVLLYVVWQLWLGDIIIGAERTSQAAALSEEWAVEAPAAPPTTEPASPAVDEPVEPAAPVAVEPVILPEPGAGEVFGIMHIPRFGPEYAYKMAGGVSRATTLDPIGIGHYPDTPMPGAVGNVALAAHRTTYGKPFADIASLRIGDAIVIEVEAGWYTYRFRTLEYVQPDETSVLNPVPQRDTVEATGRYLTMTSCSPKFSLAERIVAYSVFESFTPRSDPPPSSLAAVS